MSEKDEALVVLKDLCKNYGVTVALNHVDMQIFRGEIRGLIGENGSGKSTVTTILAGIQKPTSGAMYFQGKPWKPASNLESVRAGIGIIVQEAGLIPSITVAENMFLGDYSRFRSGPFIFRSRMIGAARKALEKIGITHIDPALPTYFYNMEERKLIEIAKTLASEPEVFIVDETSTALSEQGRKILYRAMHEAADQGKAVIFISHDLEELMAHCDSLTILRDGNLIDNLDRTDFDENDIKRKMIGREINSDYYRLDQEGYMPEVVLKATNLTTMTDLLCFNMELHKGEILGIGGLSECGMHSLGKALYGLESLVDGEVRLVAANRQVTAPDVAFANKMGYLSKNRDAESLEINASVGANIQSTGYRINRIWGPFISPKKEKEYAAMMVDKLAIKCVDMFQSVKALSGGNKQKVVFGKWVAVDADILILDCPTRGVDIGVKAAMYQLISEMKKAGKSIVMISEELPELCGMSDRILILKDSQITGEFYRKDGFNTQKMIECMI